MAGIELVGLLYVGFYSPNGCPETGDRRNLFTASAENWESRFRVVSIFPDFTVAYSVFSTYSRSTCYCLCGTVCTCNLSVQNTKNDLKWSWAHPTSNFSKTTKWNIISIQLPIMKLTNALYLAALSSVATAEVTSLTKKSYDKLTDGKTVFIKCVIFHSKWWMIRFFQEWISNTFHCARPQIFRSLVWALQENGNYLLKKNCVLGTIKYHKLSIVRFFHLPNLKPKGTSKHLDSCTTQAIMPAETNSIYSSPL